MRLCALQHARKLPLHTLCAVLEPHLNPYSPPHTHTPYALLFDRKLQQKVAELHAACRAPSAAAQLPALQQQAQSFQQQLQKAQGVFLQAGMMAQLQGVQRSFMVAKQPLEGLAAAQGAGRPEVVLVSASARPDAALLS